MFSIHVFSNVCFFFFFRSESNRLLFICPQLSDSKSSSTAYLSLAQSLFPLGQGISQPIAGLFVKKSRQIKLVLILSLIIAIGGNVVYMAAPKAGTVILIIVGRAIAGFGAGG